MRQVPGSLIQIHYHNRLGGVRQVMEQYSAAFRRCFTSDAYDYRFCRVSDRYRGSAQLIDIPAAEYHLFRSATAFRSIVERCKKQLLAAFTSVPLRYPAIVIGHNLNLGKNPALSEAFRWCAARLGSDPDRFRFFLVMHDFAEQGRLDLLRSIHRLSKKGTDVYPSLYASGAPVHYITLNTECTQRTGLGKRNCSMLPNNINEDEVEYQQPHNMSIRELLQRYAKEHRIAFDIGKPLFCYPSRMIYRKNLLEALLLATVLWDGILVTGKCGNAAGDRNIFRLAVDIVRKNALPFITDPSKIRGMETERNPFNPLYTAADCVLSTSVAEGFGYGLHEPWSFNCPVVCRKPVGTTFLSGLKIPSVYRKVPIPVSWIDCDKVYNRLSSAFHDTFTNAYWSKRSFLKNSITEDTIDFSLVDVEQQATVIRRILKSDSVRADITGLLMKRHDGWPGTNRLLHFDGSVTEYNRRLLANRNHHEFDNEFVKVFGRDDITIAPEKWYERIGEYYRRPENFQLLVVN